MKSGRKPLPSNQRRVPLTVFIAPETNNLLRGVASDNGISLGKALDAMMQDAVNWCRFHKMIDKI